MRHDKTDVTSWLREHVAEEIVPSVIEKPPINRMAVFSDSSPNYQFPDEPEPYSRVKVRIRVGKNDPDEVMVIVNGKPHKLNLVPDLGTDYFDFYEGSFNIDDSLVTYFYQITKGTQTMYFNRQGDVDEVDSYFNFSILPGFHTPEWAKGAVMYQIFVDRFYNGDKENDVVDNEYAYIGEPVRHVSRWRDYPASMDVRNFYGGDLKGVLKKLDYLQDLGVEVLYLNPIFVSPSNHKYDIQDYDHVDPHFTVIEEDGGEPLAEGDTDNAHATRYIKRVTDPKNLKASNDFFAHFMEEVHARGMKVILDGVFNHCGSFNKWMDREKLYHLAGGYDPGAYESETSPYHTFFKFYEGDDWPDNEFYDAWWGNDTLPKLNYEESPKLYQYILRIAAKWLAPPYNVDGWRLDVAADLGHSEELNHKFWKDFRDTVKRINPDALILAEHYGDPSAWLDGRQWDSVMNYDAFMEPVTWFLTGMDKHSDVSKPELRGDQNAFFASMTNFNARLPLQSLQVAMNELSNHDHSRFLTRTNFTVGRTAFSGPMAAEVNIKPCIMRQAVVMQMTWRGAPTLYYGDEAGLCGWTDPDNRRTYPWHHEDREMINFHKEMIRIHRDYQALKKGTLMYLLSERNLISYGRYDDRDSFFVVIQVDGEEREVEIDVWRLGISDGQNVVRMMWSDENGYTIRSESLRSEGGKVRVRVGRNGAVVWKSLDY
ncbi:MAG: glycoside hydrolase family 13 protein [Eubacterium sp.]|nr:glycoside hydrolase family 13 protein [Eubacterium sp.]